MQWVTLEKFNENTEAILRPHLFQQALQIQPTESLFIKATEFLKRVSPVILYTHTLRKFADEKKYAVEA